METNPRRVLPHSCSDWDRSLNDVANCACWVYLPVCVECESSKGWADIYIGSWVHQQGDQGPVKFKSKKTRSRP